MGNATGGGAVSRGGAANEAGGAAGGVSSSSGGLSSIAGTSAGGKAATGGSSLGGTSGAGGKASTGGSSSLGGAAGNAGKVSTGGSGVAGSAGSVGTPNVIIDRSKEFQTIDGFGFFGAQDVWWGASSDMWSDAWGTQVIKDLGITVWRSEYYSEESGQDANWAKQRPVVEGMKRIADANRVPLKFILTVWSPPSSMKCAVDSVQSGSTPCAVHSDGLKNGGTLDPAKYGAYAQWLAKGIDNYAAVGVDLYAISPQNEPMFVEPYNSCVYDIDPAKLNSYARMATAVSPALKQLHPNVKIFGTENMLELEGQEWFYSASMTSAAWTALDILAYHGYQDGVAPTAGSQLATYWTYVQKNWAKPRNKVSWMTETSGYTDTWAGTNGARSLGYAIYSALSYGQVSAWVWWQGSELGGAPGQYTLMGGTQYRGKRYYVSKNYYRYVRPGAKMLQASSTEPELFVVAFAHAAMQSFTVVAINTATTDKHLVLGGANVPSTFEAYRTSATEDCAPVGSVTNGSIILRADSITTLVNGNVFE